MNKVIEMRLAKLEGQRKPRVPTMSQAERDEAVRLSLLGPMPDLDAIGGDPMLRAARRAAILACFRADT